MSSSLHFSTKRSEFPNSPKGSTIRNKGSKNEPVEVTVNDCFRELHKRIRQIWPIDIEIIVLSHIEYVCALVRAVNNKIEK